MRRNTLYLALACFLAAAAPAPSPAPAAESPETTPEQYTLRYRFRPGEILRWKVVHQAKIKTTVSGTTQTVETESHSVKVWRVQEVAADGTATFDHLVENVDMRQRISGRREIRYNSQTDDQPPPGFERVAQSIGVPISTFTLSPRGETLQRKPRQETGDQSQPGQVTIPLPEKPVAVGESWSFPHPIHVPLRTGGFRKVQTRQKFTLAEVRDGVARIEVATQILTPIHDPAIQAQLVQRASSGTVEFDIRQGRIVGQQMDVDQVVVGFQGQASSLHYLSHFREEYLDQPAQTAARDATTK